MLNVVASGDISAATIPTLTAVDTGNLTGTGASDTVTLTGTQLDAILIGAGTVNLGGGAADTINITSTSADLNALANGSLTNTEIISAAAAAAGVTITLNNQTEGFTITGSGFNDTIRGGTGADTINAGAGDDSVEGNTGNDTLTGGTGTDTLTYANAAAGVQVDLSVVTAQNTVNAGTDTLSGFENLTGSAFTDVLEGDSGAKS